jgi:REP element-mobilizing transposase RayT
MAQAWVMRIDMAHSNTKLLYHSIFSTKGRRAYIKDAVRQRLYPYIESVLRAKGGDLLAIGGTADHVHLLVELPATLPVADAMRLVKTNSSKWLGETFLTHREFGWQTGYGAFTVSASAREDVIRYIDNQGQHHRSRTFQEEFVEFLNRHELEYNARYLWD